MGKLHITEYGGLVQTSGGVAPYPNEPALANQAITYTTTTPSAAFGANTRLVRLISDGLVFLKFGATPTADAGDSRLPADTIEYLGVKPGDKVAAYDGVT